jgi:NADH-quinone oxidoreductase subunit A
MPALVLFLLVFLAVAVIFLFFHLLMGSVLRPARPEPEKLTIYECGEPTVGSAWIQFDLRYYVVALLFVVFDVEVAFFFPWAVVFGPLTTLANEPDATVRANLVKAHQLQDYQLPPVPLAGENDRQARERARGEVITQKAAWSWAWVAFLDIVVFFGVLMVGFAYLWRRGDIDWVRTITHSTPVQPVAEALPPSRDTPELATAQSKA